MAIGRDGGLIGRMRRLAFVLSVVLLLPGLFAACTPADAAHTLNVLAGSELRDLEPLFPEIERATGVKIVPTYIGTLEGAEQIAAGDTSDAAWFSHGKYLSLLPGAGSKIVASEKIMLSPVIIGVKQSVAQNFGWVNNPEVSWKDIQAKSADGSFHFAMTNPASSNSGFTALIGVASALSGSSDAIDTGNIDTEALKAFFRGQNLTAGSSGFLADDFVRQQDALDGIINYESILMGLNAGGKLHEPLTLIYPKEGIITADYPFMLLKADKRDSYDKVVEYLRKPEIQTRIMTDTARRPVVPGVLLDARFRASPRRAAVPVQARHDRRAAHRLPRPDPQAGVGGVRARRQWLDGRHPAGLAQGIAKGADRTGHFADRQVRPLPCPRGRHVHHVLHRGPGRADFHDRRHRSKLGRHAGDPCLRRRPRGQRQHSHLLRNPRGIFVSADPAGERSGIASTRSCS